MALKGKSIKSKASGFSGRISGVDGNNLLVSFTGVQDVTIPLDKAEKLLEMDEETLAELREEIKSQQISILTPRPSKVETYMDNFEEGDEDEDDEDQKDPLLGMMFEEDEEETE